MISAIELFNVNGLIKKQEWEQLVKAAPTRLRQITLFSTSGYVYYGWLNLHLRIACTAHFCILQPFAFRHCLLQLYRQAIPWVFLAVYLPGWSVFRTSELKHFSRFASAQCGTLNFAVYWVTRRDFGNLRLFCLPPYNSTIKRTCVFLKLTELLRTSLFVQPPTLQMCGPESPDDQVLFSVKNISPSPHLQRDLLLLTWYIKSNRINTFHQIFLPILTNIVSTEDMKNC